MGIVLGLCVLATSMAACGDHVSKREAKRGWRSTRAAMSRAGVSGALSVSGMVGPDGVSAEAEGTFDCADGGSVAVITKGEVTSDNIAASLELEFIGCKVDRVVTDGELDYEATVTTEEVAVTYVGALDWSGRANGSCVIDASARVSAKSISLNFSGDVCGYDWNDLR